MLAGGRLDYVISNHMQLNRALRDISSTTPLHVSKTLLALDVYPILHQKHRALIPSLDRYLTQLSQCLGGPLSQANSGAWFSIVPTDIEQCLTPPLEPQP